VKNEWSAAIRIHLKGEDGFMCDRGNNKSVRSQKKGRVEESATKHPQGSESKKNCRLYHSPRTRTKKPDPSLKTHKQGGKHYNDIELQGKKMLKVRGCKRNNAGTQAKGEAITLRFVGEHRNSIPPRGGGRK